MSAQWKERDGLHTLSLGGDLVNVYVDWSPRGYSTIKIHGWTDFKDWRKARDLEEIKRIAEQMAREALQRALADLPTVTVAIEDGE